MTALSLVTKSFQMNVRRQIKKIKKRPRHMTLEIQVLAWDRHKNVVGLNQ